MNPAHVASLLGIACLLGCQRPCPVSVVPVAFAPVEGVPTARTLYQSYTLERGPLKMEVDPSDGARIIGFGLDGGNVLMTRDEVPDGYGTSFWPSPQADWGWPPPHEIATAPYRAEVRGDSLVLQSRVFAKLSISAEKVIRLDARCDCAIVTYTLHNRGSSPRKVAPWQNTRVRSLGLTFYPSAGPPLALSTLRVDASRSVTFYKNDPPSQAGKGLKAFADGAEGWLAHVAGDLLLVQSFADVPKQTQAPGEAEIEIYSDGDGRFVEIEVQGPYTELAPGQSVSWPVRWALKRLPAGTRAEPGSDALVALARTMAAMR
jgi:hypothetical protein